jgi:DNA-binding beta-propeller fold protein YncE
MTNNRFFVADTGNNRVLVYNIGNKAPIAVLGQSTLTGWQQGTSVSGMNGPTGIAYENNMLFVADTLNNRVLVFDVNGIVNGENAIFVLGQPDFTSNFNATTQSGVNQPRGLATDSANNLLYVSDYGNNRVLVFNVGTILNGMAAQKVLGQSNFVLGSSGVSATQLNGPKGLTYDQSGTRLFVADANNNRVLVFDVSVISDGEAAVSVLGQASFTSSGPSLSSSRMNHPVALAFDSATKRLFVCDSGNNRVTGFDVTTISNGENAINVLGQPNLNTSTPYTSQSVLWNPVGVAYDSVNKVILVTEESNNRMILFDVLTVTNGESAVDLIGQYNSPSSTATINYTKSGASTQGNNTPTELSLSNPVGTAIDSIHHRLFVADYQANRVLVFNLDVNNTLIDHTADYVLGQSNFYSTVQTTTQNGLWNPGGLTYDALNDRLFVSDQSNNRVLIYDTVSIVNGENAFKVLGQADFVSNTTGVTASKINAPGGLAFDPTGNRLFVAETASSNRVLVFNVATVTNGQNASNVLGQSDFTSSASGLSPSQMSYPGGLAYDDPNNRLFVADHDNNRVLVFNVTTITNGQNAIRVLGQPDFTTNTAGTTQALMDHPWGLSYDVVNQRLFVSEIGSNRVLIFDAATISNGQNARSVFGQPDFVSNQQTVTPAGLSMPWGISYSNNRLYVADNNNNRVMIFNTWGF